MKKKKNFLAFMLFLTGSFLSFSISSFAGSIDYITNQSAKFVMNQARMAATDGADIVAYNPAGAALMPEGLYLDVNEQCLFMVYDETFKNQNQSPELSESYKDRKTIPIVPSVYGIYNMGKQGVGSLAFSLKAGVIGGGGGLDWNGNTGVAYSAIKIASTIPSAYATTATGTDIKSKVSSVYYGIGGNVAYSILDDKVSFSVGAQEVISKKTAETKGNFNFYTPAFGANSEWSLYIDSEYTYDAKGYNFQFGLDVRPIKDLTIGCRYETEAALNFKYHEKEAYADPSITNAVTSTVKNNVEGSLSVAGKTFDYNLPQIFAWGVEYKLTPAITLGTGGTYFFLQEADMDGYQKFLKKAGYEYYLGVTWAVVPSLLKVGTSLTYSDQGGLDSLQSAEDNPETGESGQIIKVQGATNIASKLGLWGAGVTYNILPDLELTVAGAALTSITGKEKATTDSGYKVSYYKDIYFIGVGVSYKVL